MCNRCSNYYYGGNCNQSWGSHRCLNRCRHALQNLSEEAANAADLVTIAEAFEDRCGYNTGCGRSKTSTSSYETRCQRSGCGCNNGCHSTCECNRCQYRRCVRNCQRYL